MTNHDPDSDLTELFKSQRKLDAKRVPAFSELFLKPERSPNSVFNWFRISVAGTAAVAIAAAVWLTWFSVSPQPRATAERSFDYNTAAEPDSTLYAWVPASDCLLVRSQNMQLSQYTAGSDNLLPQDADSVHNLKEKGSL